MVNGQAKASIFRPDVINHQPGRSNKHLEKISLNFRNSASHAGPM